MTLDSRTVFVMAVGFLGVTAITLGLLVRTLPADTRRGARVGTLATVILGVSWVLFALEGLIPEALSLLGGNLLYLLAAALVYHSIRLLDGEKPARWVYAYVVVPTILATALTRYVVDAYPVRVMIMSAALALLLGLAARQLFAAPRGAMPNPGRRAAAYWLSASSALLVVRVAITLIQGGAPALLGDEPLPNLVLAISVVVALGAVFAYFLLFSGRVTAELAMQARLDPLTELLNRRGFEERAKQELRRAARGGAPVSLLMIDADEFKTINDLWGHQAGDEALRAIANGLRARVRPYDLVARLGGDEFVVFLPGMDERSTAALLPRLRESIAGQPTKHQGSLDVSIGSATLPASGSEGGRASASVKAEDEAEVLRQLVAAADRDLYGLKRTRF